MNECKGMSVIGLIAYTLILVGAINWGLIGWLDFNLVTFLFGEGSLLTRIVYMLVGFCAIVSLFAGIFDYFKNRN